MLFKYEFKLIPAVPWFYTGPSLVGDECRGPVTLQRDALKRA